MAHKWFQLKDFIITKKAETENDTDEVIWRSLTHQEFSWLHLLVSVAITCISGIGIGTNAINIYVFIKSKTTEGVDLCLLSLSISDFLFSLLNTVRGAAMVLYSLEILSGPFYESDPSLVEYYSAGLGIICYTQSGLITLFIGVARCACVLMPLKFRNMFTGKRCLVVIILLGTFAFFSKFPSVAAEYLTYKKVTKDADWTRLVRVRYPEKKLLKAVATLLAHTILPFATQIVLSLCVVVMVGAMKRASRIRQRASVTKGDHKSSLSDKEWQVVQQVVLVCAVFLVCSVPKMAFGAVTQFVPSVQRKMRDMGHDRLYYLVKQFRRVFESINGSVNILVYLKYNKVYRGLYNENIKWCRKTNSDNASND